MKYKYKSDQREEIGKVVYRVDTIHNIQTIQNFQNRDGWVFSEFSDYLLRFLNIQTIQTMGAGHRIF